MTLKISAAAILPLFMLGCSQTDQSDTAADVPVDLVTRANTLAQELIIVDTHIDVPYRLTDKWDDVSGATEDGDFDYPRAVAGGLNAPFMSIYNSN